MSNWVHLMTAPDQLTGEIWVSILRDAGLRAMIRPSDVSSFLGVSSYGCRVQVMEEDLNAARQVLSEVSDIEPE